MQRACAEPCRRQACSAESSLPFTGDRSLQDSRCCIVGRIPTNVHGETFDRRHDWLLTASYRTILIAISTPMPLIFPLSLPLPLSRSLWQDCPFHSRGPPISNVRGFSLPKPCCLRCVQVSGGRQPCWRGECVDELFPGRLLTGRRMPGRQKIEGVLIRLLPMSSVQKTGSERGSVKGSQSETGNTPCAELVQSIADATPRLKLGRPAIQPVHAPCRCVAHMLLAV